MSDTGLSISANSGIINPTNSSTLNPALKAMFSVGEVQKLPEMNLLDYKKLVEPLGALIQTNYGIIPLVPIVQSAHESRNGNSGLARNHGNLFGIVATESWKQKGGKFCSMPTFEFIKGNRVDMAREFRAYDSWEDSFRDWANLISGLNVYKKAYSLLKDLGTVADGITEMGKVYATDPQYARSLLDIYSQLNA